MSLIRKLIVKAWKLIADENQKDDFEKFVSRLNCDRQREYSWMHDGDRK